MKYIINNSMPNQFNVSTFEGDIYKGDQIIRRAACRHYREIDNMHQLKACLRAGEYAWPGGYACFFITNDGVALSFEAVMDNYEEICHDMIHEWKDTGWYIAAMECIANCDESVFCDHTGKEIA